MNWFGTFIGEIREVNPVNRSQFMDLNISHFIEPNEDFQ
ncbi:hypothetical protein KKY_3299 [Pelagibacterium halotolerans B2]|uniref:Uncharacterized protein n=1 Tax=Pelagibacterium halotolerans (strain DSM 22347 / JCM 15775 / CGMCC 1.7692 / B2) TaxID=1082931 RepID=G4R7M7_PELHB|nr:hypothetical protein KKY_3299 [Pelagibacterium halotolerans B2]